MNPPNPPAPEAKICKQCEKPIRPEAPFIRLEDETIYCGNNCHWVGTKSPFGNPTKPTHARYVAIGPRVMLAAQACATAVSNTMAKRIANALNAYIPASRRGK